MRIFPRCASERVAVLGLGLQLIEHGVSDLGRMRGRVDLFQLSNGYLRIDLCRRSIGVSA
jgi:hypothetical protein